MKRLTTDYPDGSFEIMRNFVFSRDGQTYIYHDGEKDDVPLHDWIKRQCLERGCDELPCSTPEELDKAVTECAMDRLNYDRICPIALAYVFATQAVALRDRLKKYEDLFYSGSGTETFLPLITREAAQNEPLTLEEMRLSLEIESIAPMWIKLLESGAVFPAVVDDFQGKLMAVFGYDFNECVRRECDYGKTWLMYTRPPVDESTP